MQMGEGRRQETRHFGNVRCSSENYATWDSVCAKLCKIMLKYYAKSCSLAWRSILHATVTVFSFFHRIRHQDKEADNSCQLHQYMIPDQCSLRHQDGMGCAAPQKSHFWVLQHRDWFSRILFLLLQQSSMLFTFSGSNRGCENLHSDILWNAESCHGRPQSKYGQGLRIIYLPQNSP